MNDLHFLYFNIKHSIAYHKHIMAVIFTVQSRIIKISAKNFQTPFGVLVQKTILAVACYNSSDLTGYILSDDFRLIHNEFCT